ncbi:MAG: hypothetical protein HFI99_16900 [Lachnospiraceae bacterium]|nr:hypothetical protein [Lachnospiraceae bacterium]
MQINRSTMTTDHLVSVIYPNYPTGWWIILLHILGRLATSVMWPLFWGLTA